MKSSYRIRAIYPPCAFYCGYGVVREQAVLLELWSTVRPHGTFKVVEIAPGSAAADTGIQRGDTLLALNGQAVERLSLHQLNLQLATTTSAQVNVTISRQGVTKAYTLSPRKGYRPTGTDAYRPAHMNAVMGII